MASVIDDVDISADYLKQNSARDWFWDVLTWHQMMFTTKTLTLGRGETAPLAYLRKQGRALFLGALYRCVPNLTDDLLTPELDRLFHDAAELRRRWADESGPTLGKDCAERAAAKTTSCYLALMKANEKITDYFKAWQARYNLTDPWLHDAAYEASRFAMDVGPRYGIPIPSPVPLFLGDADICSNPHIDKETEEEAQSRRGLFAQGKFRWIPEHRLKDIPVALDELKFPDIKGPEYDQEDEGFLGTFDPRTQTIDDAVNSLMPELERRLRYALKKITDIELEFNRDVRKPKTIRKVASFEWLVRYQVLGESMGSIAKAVGKGKGHVSEAINETAELIGLTLREPSKGGRPPKTVSLEIANS